MSFGNKVYQHRFYTVPKLRNRHVNQFINEQSSSPYQRLRSFSSFQNNPSSPQIMKQSYLRLIQNGINSRFVTKNQLGYQGLKFQNDVINRYAENDYVKNAEILEKFRRQAQNSKKNNKYSHARKMTTNNINSSGQGRYQYSGSPHNQMLNNKNSISLLPVTYSPSFHIQKTKQLDSNIFPGNYKLPQITHKYQQEENKNTTRSIVIEQQSQRIQQQNSGNQNYTNSDNKQFHENQFINVGVNTKKQRNESQNKFKFIKLEKQKIKNKLLKKKYQTVKKRLIQKSLMLSHHEKIQEQREQLENSRKFDQKIEDLSGMLNNICQTIRSNNQHFVETLNSSKIKGKQYGQISKRQSQNSTQINLLNSQRLRKLTQIQQSMIQQSRQKDFNNQNQEDYAQQLKKINSNQKARPKVLYTFQKHNKKVNYDALKLIKNRLKQKFYLDSLGDYSSPITKKKEQQIQLKNTSSQLQRKFKTEPF